MRRILSINRFALIYLVVLSMTGISARAGEDQTREAMKGSIVYLEISSYGYDQLRPWKNTDVQQRDGVGCATGAYQVITPAWNLIDAKLIKAKVSGQNEYIPVKIKTIDYEIDLALLELEPNTMKKPLKPVRFADKFQRGAKLNYYWLNPVGEMTTGQGYLDRAELQHSTVSYTYLFAQMDVLLCQLVKTHLCECGILQRVNVDGYLRGTLFHLLPLPFLVAENVLLSLVPIITFDS